MANTARWKLHVRDQKFQSPLRGDIAGVMRRCRSFSISQISPWWNMVEADKPNGAAGRAGLFNVHWLLPDTHGHPSLQPRRGRCQKPLPFATNWWCAGGFLLVETECDVLFTVLCRLVEVGRVWGIPGQCSAANPTQTSWVWWWAEQGLQQHPHKMVF